MYAAIFQARIAKLDNDYFETGARLRTKAREIYGCLDTVSVKEGSEEITISCWKSLDQIQNWKQDLDHLAAQEKGKSQWYKSYQVQIVRVIREYPG